MSTTYSMHPTDEMCWLHRGTVLYAVEMSNGESGLYCRECDGPSHPERRPDPAAALIMARYARRIDRRTFWQRLFTRGVP